MIPALMGPHYPTAHPRRSDWSCRVREGILLPCAAREMPLTHEHFLARLVRRSNGHNRHSPRPPAAHPLDRKFHTDSHGLRIGDRQQQDPCCQQYTWPVVVIEMMKERVVD